VVRTIQGHQPQQARFVEHDHVIETLATSGSNESLDECILPRRTGGREHFLNPHRLRRGPKVVECMIAIVEQVATEAVAGAPCISRRSPERRRSPISAVRHESVARPNAGLPAPSCESASGRRRARSVARCGVGSSTSTTAGSPVGAGDDGLRLDDHQRRSPSSPDAGEHDPKAPVHLGEPQPSRSGALQHLQLVSSREDFELERRAGTCPSWDGQENGQEQRHRPEAYPSLAATSTAATRTDFFGTHNNVARSHAALDGHTPLTFGGELVVAPADLNNVRWVSHCRGLVQLPAAA
jgi:hypothetical protein